MAQAAGSHILWRLQIEVPVPARLARRASEKALAKWMAEALVRSCANIPPEFIVKSTAAVQKEARSRGLRLVGPDGQEIGSGSNGSNGRGARPFKL